MSTTLTHPSAQSALRSTARQDGVAAVLGLWMIGGLYADGWAHLNVGGLDSFFTPWHGVLYSGFTATAGWLAWTIWSSRRRSPGGGWRAWLPQPYRLGALGVIVFGLAGVADMLWHLAFGIETKVDALVSPTHLVLLIGGTLLQTNPLRGVLQRHNGLPGSPAQAWPAIVSMGAAATLGAFFLSYLGVFTQPLATIALTTIPEGAPGHLEGELPASAGLAGYLLSMLTLVVPLLWLRRRGPLPAGTVTAITALVALPGAALTEFRYGTAAVLAVVAAAAVDIVLWFWTRRSGRPVTPLGIGIVAPLLIWPAQLLGLAIDDRVAWSATMWTGAVALSVLAGAVIGLLATGRH